MRDCLNPVRRRERRLRRPPRLLVLLWLAAVVACDAGPGALDVSYTIRIDDPASATAAISVTIADLPANLDTLRLAMSPRYAFVTPPEPRIVGQIAVAGGPGAVAPPVRTGPHDWSLPVGGARELRLEYAVRLDHRSLPEVVGRDEYEQPFLTDTFGLLSTGALLLVPDAGRPLAPTVRFELPDGWRAVCPWPADGAGGWAPPRPDALWSDLVAVGDWETHVSARSGCELTIALAPGQEQPAEEIVPFVTAIVEEELALFGRLPADRYLLLFNTPNERLLAGSAKSGSLVISLPTGPGAFSLAKMSRLIAHEFHHTWVASLYTPPPELRFFNEGFTDYYAHLVCARLGIISPDAFSRALGEKMDCTLARHNREPLSLKAAGGDPYFTDRYAFELCYRGGLLIAALLDLDLRGRGDGRGLDPFMRAFNNDPDRWSDPAAPGLEDLLALIAAELGDGRAAEYRRLIEAPWDLDAAAAFGRRGVAVTREARGVARDMLVRMADARLTSVDPCGPAGRIGLRDGDVVLELNGRRVATENDIRGAWWQLGGDVVRARIRRGDEELLLTAPRPEEIRFQVAIPADLFPD